MPDAPTVFVIGAGRAGRSLAAALVAGGTPDVALHGRDRPFGPAIAAADVVVVATPDAVVGDVLGALAATADTPFGPRPDAVVLQMSGARLPDGTDAELRARVAGVGTFHPLVALADPASSAGRLRGAWVGLGGDVAALVAGEALARRIGAHALRVPDGPDARAIYHAAAVFASNFPVVLAAVAERLFEAAGVDREGARGAVRHLLASAAANVAAADDPAAALTGPVARGDVPTVARHLASLSRDPAIAALYRELARATLELARARRDARPVGLDAIAALIG